MDKQTLTDKLTPPRAGGTPRKPVEKGSGAPAKGIAGLSPLPEKRPPRRAFGLLRARRRA
jgi:hypothetical protein